MHDKLKHQNVDEILQHLHSYDNDIRMEAVRYISLYIAHENESAYEGLINYYMALEPADNLEEVHLRKEIVEVLHTKISDKKTINAYVNELARTPSNNTTRQLYTKILEYLEKCPPELTMDPLLELLKKRKYSYKMKNRILDIINMKYYNWYDA